MTVFYVMDAGRSYAGIPAACDGKIPVCGRSGSHSHAFQWPVRMIWSLNIFEKRFIGMMYVYFIHG